jgi:hypothetical protein
MITKTEQMIEIGFVSKNYPKYGRGKYLVTKYYFFGIRFYKSMVQQTLRQWSRWGWYE